MVRAQIKQQIQSSKTWFGWCNPWKKEALLRKKRK